MAEQFANSANLDQTPHSAVSDLGLHCLPILSISLLGVTRLKWVDVISIVIKVSILKISSSRCQSRAIQVMEHLFMTRGQTENQCKSKLDKSFQLYFNFLKQHINNQ